MHRYRIRQLTLPLREKGEYRRHLARRLSLPEAALTDVVPIRVSLDNRKGHPPRWSAHVEFSAAVELPTGGDLMPAEGERDPSPLEEEGSVLFPDRVQIVGAGPAGLWAAYTFLRRGYRVVLHERGKPVEERFRDLRRFLKQGDLSPDSNLLFGEGGAGTFSDGKLTSRSENRYTRRVLADLVECGAPPETAYSTRAHLGTDRLLSILKELRRRILERGGEIRFGSRLEELEVAGGALRAIRVVSTETGISETIPAEAVVLAGGHSARDLYRAVAAAGVTLEPKPFAVGVRVEHPQELINRRHFSRPEEIRYAGPAEYTLRAPAERGGGYSFCMCPGGVLLPCASAPGELSTNGMSYSRRNSRWANSAIVIPVDFGREEVWKGVEFQQQLERRAFELGGGDYSAPAQTLRGLIDDRLDRAPLPASSWPRSLRNTRLGELFGDPLRERLAGSLLDFDRKIPGFIREGIAVAPETRTSSPLRILRSPETLESVSVQGVYPLGEGAGYAGGIVSSAADGVRLAAAARLRKGRA